MKTIKTKYGKPDRGLRPVESITIELNQREVDMIVDAIAAYFPIPKVTPVRRYQLRSLALRLVREMEPKEME